jgi:hypothetical protein
MSPSLARASVIVLSFVVLALSAAVTVVAWYFLSPLPAFARGMLSLLAWVSAYYVGANLLFWRAVVRISSARLSQRA